MLQQLLLRQTFTWHEVNLLLQVLLTDTVGFIQKLPTQLVAAFRATLEEITEASLLLHVVDVSHPNAAAQTQAVMQVCQDTAVMRAKQLSCLPLLLHSSDIHGGPVR